MNRVRFGMVSVCARLIIAGILPDTWKVGDAAGATPSARKVPPLPSQRRGRTQGYAGWCGYFKRIAGSAKKAIKTNTEFVEFMDDLFKFGHEAAFRRARSQRRVERIRHAMPISVLWLAILAVIALIVWMAWPVATPTPAQPTRQSQYLRRAFFAARTFADVDDPNPQFRRWRDEIAHQRPHPELRDQTVAQLTRVTLLAGIDQRHSGCAALSDTDGLAIGAAVCPTEQECRTATYAASVCSSDERTVHRQSGESSER